MLHYDMACDSAMSHHSYISTPTDVAMHCWICTGNRLAKLKAPFRYLGIAS